MGHVAITYLYLRTTFLTQQKARAVPGLLPREKVRWLFWQGPVEIAGRIETLRHNTQLLTQAG